MRESAQQLLIFNYDLNVKIYNSIKINKELNYFETNLIKNAINALNNKQYYANSKIYISKNFKTCANLRTRNYKNSKICSNLKIL